MGTPSLAVVEGGTVKALQVGARSEALRQAAVLAGKAVPPVRDIGDRITDANFARMQADGAALAAALDGLIAARRADPAAHPAPTR